MIKPKLAPEDVACNADLVCAAVVGACMTSAEAATVAAASLTIDDEAESPVALVLAPSSS